jgi:hypothetical protein
MPAIAYASFRLNFQLIVSRTKLQEFRHLPTASEVTDDLSHGRTLYHKAATPPKGILQTGKHERDEESMITDGECADEGVKTRPARGHASIVLTLDTYSHVLPSMQQAATAKLESLLFKHTGTA